MKRYRAVPDHGYNAQAQSLGMQGLSQSQQMMAALQNQGPSVRFVEDENGPWVRWADVAPLLSDPPSPAEKLSRKRCERCGLDLGEIGECQDCNPNAFR